MFYLDLIQTNKKQRFNLANKLIIICLAFYSCTVSDLAVSKPTTLGQVFFMLNGKTYQMQGRGILAPSTTNNSFLITATNSQKETISINIINFDTNTPYNLQKNVVIGFASTGITQANNLCTQATNSVIQLNEFDKQNKIASGSFEGGICTMQNAVSVVSNGSFKVEFD